MNKECVGCAAIEKCNVAIQPRSVMCQIYRLQSGQTKAEKERAGEVGKKKPEALKRILERLDKELSMHKISPTFHPEYTEGFRKGLTKAIEIIKEEIE